MTAASSSVFARFRPLVALRHPSYRLLMAGVAPGMIAMQMGSVALGYLAYTLSGSATALGLIGLGWGIPMLVLSLVGGVVADRFPRRSIILGTQSVVGSAALLAAILVLTGLIQVWHLFLIALIQGTAFAFNMPARQALVAELVGREDLGSAVALNNSILNFSRVVGPPIAGVLIGWPAIGLKGVFIIMASAYIVVLLTLVRLPRMAAPKRAQQRSGWGDLKHGLGFIAHTPALVALLVLAFVPMFLGMPYMTLLPVFALSVFQAGPEGLGVLSMASGLGALGGSIGVTFVADSPHKRLIQSISGVIFGLGLVGFAFSSNFLLAVLLLAVVGAASAGYGSINNTLVMQTTPREFHGRVMSVYMMTFSLMPLASLPVARLADLVGAPTTVGSMGILLVLAVLAVTTWQRRVAARPPEKVTSVAAD